MRAVVTHHLHVLPRVDEIICLENGKIAERGTFNELVARGGSFSKLVEEFSVQERKESGAIDALDSQNKSVAGKEKADKPTAPAKLFAGDERRVGAVRGCAHATIRSDGMLTLIYAAGASMYRICAPLEACTGLSFSSLHSRSPRPPRSSAPSYLDSGLKTPFLASPMRNTWPYTRARTRMTSSLLADLLVCSGLGLSTAFLTFFAAMGFAFAGYQASLSLFSAALRGVLFTDLQWHDKTPTGAITNRLSKDIDTVDSTLPRNSMSFLQDLASILGTVALVFYSYAWLGLSKHVLPSLLEPDLL